MKQLKIVMLGDSLSKQGGIVTLEKLMIEQAPPNIQIQHIGTVVDGSGTDKVLVFATALSQFVWHLLSKEVDLIHIHVAERGSAFRKAIITILAKLVFRKPVILHSNSPEFHVFYHQLPPLVQKWLRWAFCQCDCFIAVSQTWRNFYIQNLGLKAEQVVVLANPIKFPATVPLRTDVDKVCFVSLGRIGQRKGAFDLIKSFSILPDEDKSQANLILAGDGDVEKARNLVESLNLSEYVTILDWLNSDRRDALLAKADVFVLPTSNEGLPLALLEAMSWGLPVITTPVGGIPDIVTQNQNGLLVEPEDIQALSKAMQSLIQNKNLRLYLGSNARESVKNFDINYYFNRLVIIYSSVLGLKEQSHVCTAKQ